MHKKSFKMLCFLMLILGNSLIAQENSENKKVKDKIKDHLKLSFDLGHSSSNRKANFSALVNSDYVPGCGFGMNLSVEYIFLKKFLASIGVSYLQKNYTFQRDAAYTGWYTKYKQDFLSVPLMLGGYIINHPGKDKGIWVKIAGGVYGDYLLSQYREGRYPLLPTFDADASLDHGLVSEKYDFKSNVNHFTRYGYGLQGQGQVGYSFKKFEKRWDVYGTFNYQYGLSDINNYNKREELINTYVYYLISIGLAYKF